MHVDRSNPSTSFGVVTDSDDLLFVTRIFRRRVRLRPSEEHQVCDQPTKLGGGGLDVTGNSLYLSLSYLWILVLEVRKEQEDMLRMFGTSFSMNLLAVSRPA